MAFEDLSIDKRLLEGQHCKFEMGKNIIVSSVRSANVIPAVGKQKFLFARIIT